MMLFESLYITLKFWTDCYLQYVSSRLRTSHLSPGNYLDLSEQRRVFFLAFLRGLLDRILFWLHFSKIRSGLLKLNLI